MLGRIEPEQPDAFDEAALSESHADLIVDHAELDGVRLLGVSASPVAARGLVIQESIIEGALLVGSGLPSLRCVDVRFERADASAATWIDARLVRTLLSGCKLTGLDARGAEFRDVRFDRCKAPDLMLTETTLARVRFDDCRLTGLDLGGAQIESCAICGCDARNLRLTGARIGLLDLRGSMVEGITLDHASLTGIVIDPTQAPAIAASLGVRVLMTDEQT